MYRILDWLGLTRIEHIVSGLGTMVRRLEAHAVAKAQEAEAHLAEALHRNKCASAAQAQADHATAISGKIAALIT